METARLQFSVRDTGVGIPKDKLTSIFSPFEQADASTTRKFGGTGLGLAICRKIIDLMGGEIWVESEPGIGSTFCFRAEFVLADAKALSRAASGGLPEDIAIVPASSPLKILVTEDNAVNQKLAVALLHKLGHSVVVAENGRAALGALETTSFDLVLMDIQMPEMDGFAATASIRANEQITGDHIPIIAMTAHAMTGDRERCMNAGFDGYVSKPIQIAELSATINAVRQPPASTSITTSDRSGDHQYK